LNNQYFFQDWFSSFSKSDVKTQFLTRGKSIIDFN
jgi:hypothetical protein